MNWISPILWKYMFTASLKLPCLGIPLLPCATSTSIDSVQALLSEKYNLVYANNSTKFTKQKCKKKWFEPVEIRDMTGDPNKALPLPSGPASLCFDKDVFMQVSENGMQ